MTREVWQEWPELIGYKELRRLGLSRRAVKAMVAQGRLDAVRLTGIRTKYLRSQVVTVLRLNNNNERTGGL